MKRTSPKIVLLALISFCPIFFVCEKSNAAAQLQLDSDDLIPRSTPVLNKRNKLRHPSKKGHKRGLAQTEVPNPASEEEIKDLKGKIAALRDEIDHINAELEVMRAESQAVIKRTHIGFLNQFYVSGGVSVISPRPQTFSFGTNTGLGAFLGIGHYIGRNHVVEFSLGWDLYPSMQLLYRYEFHLESPLITLGPEVGFKLKAAPLPPFDNYLDSPNQVNNSFFTFGMLFAFPVERSLATIEILYLTNQQALIFTNLGFHFFL